MNVATAQDFFSVPEIEIEKITIPEERHRDLNLQKAEVLKDSIFGDENNGNGLGLIHPIVLSPNFVLIAGLHRIASFKLAGVDKIPYTVKDYNTIDAELAEIDENLIRFDLHVDQRAVHIARREQLYREKFGDTEDVDTSYWDNEEEVDGQDSPGVRDSSENSDTEKQRNPLTTKFIKETAELTGRGTTTVRDEANLGRKILELLSPEVRDLISPTKVSDNKRELQRLLDVPDADTRLEIAQRINQSYQDNPNKQLTVGDVLSELGKQNTYETVVSVDGAATLEKALKKNESLLQISINDPNFEDEVSTWTQEGIMSVREQLFNIEATAKKGITILTDILESNEKLGK